MINKIKANYIDIPGRRIFPAQISYNDTILEITPVKEALDQYILPGFVDAHVHIESSMLIPSEFARLAVVHGTVATVSDPHEIANVLGIKGVDYMLEDAAKVNFKYNFGAPSCVPATDFETAGAVIGAEGVRELLSRPEIKYLAEMMNWPGVLSRDHLVMQKIDIAKELGKPIDGHAPGLMGEQADQYLSAGISTDHECFTYAEGLHKLQSGMKILIREGSAAKNFDALIDLLRIDADKIMFCSDDKHPDDLIQGHINQLVARALGKGYDLFDTLQAACINPVVHYGLNVGLLNVGEPADFITVDGIDQDLSVTGTWINGKNVAKDGETRIRRTESEIVNQFNTAAVSANEFNIGQLKANIRIIEVEDGQLITGSSTAKSTDLGEDQVSIASDILKIVVKDRYRSTEPAVAFVRNFNLKSGAIASTVAHDSHNIIAVGTSNDELARAINLLVENRGGISFTNGNDHMVLPLEVAGLMTSADGYTVAEKYTEMTEYVRREMGCTLSAPYMTLSFLALLVIPSLKLSDKGLFDGENFKFLPVTY